MNLKLSWLGIDPSEDDCYEYEEFSSDQESFFERESWNLVDMHIREEIYYPESNQSNEAVSDKSGKKSVAFHMWKNEKINGGVYENRTHVKGF